MKLGANVFGIGERSHPDQARQERINVVVVGLGVAELSVEWAECIR